MQRNGYMQTVGNTEEWETPQWLFNKLDAEFHFTLDPCATDLNCKCEKHYTKEDDGLSKDWKGETVFCNPPYGRDLQNWIKKCATESKKNKTTVVMLIPSRTDIKAFHDYIANRAELRFIRGRLRFGEATAPAPFANMVVIFKGRRRVKRYGTIEH